jgi:hypothetical protein
MATTKYTEYTFNNFNTTIFVLLSIIGIIIKMFFNNNYTNDGSTGPATSNIWGYGMIAFSVLGLLFIKFTIANQQKEDSGNSLSYLFELYSHAIPSLMLLLLLLWLIMLNSYYFKSINMGKVSSEYNIYSGVSTFVIILQIYIVYKSIKSDISEPSNNVFLNRLLTLLSYLLTISNAILIGILTIILKYFSTDG